MGAFDVELARLGYSSYEEITQPSYNPKLANSETLHLARVDCPGSCGEVCPNHWCGAHNGSAYEPEHLAKRYKQIVEKYKRWRK